MTASQARFPIGPLQPLTHDRAALRSAATRMLEAGAAWHALLPLDAAQLGRRPRPDAWTVAQLAHHSADAHLHGLNRLRYALTTPGYVIQPFDQDAWLTLPDAGLGVEVALNLLGAANAHWAALLDGVELSEFDRRITHPQEGGQNLWQLVAKHDWHLRHHLAQVQQTLGAHV